MKIGNVELNLDNYKGEDLYSDGDIEDEILSYAQRDLDFEKVLQYDNRWPVLYHLSHVRKFVLEWYPFDKEKTLLEIGAGCGALTSMFCEKTASVTAVELSKRRAQIIANRNRNRNNLNIFVGNIDHISENERYDYVTLIGVLEYSGKFIQGEDPYKEMLIKAKKFLKRDGTLIIAIENKFGLKYWAGYREDHTSNFFDGLEEYPNSDGIATFSKLELTELLSESGFLDLKFYYPMPDYKFATQIFSDEYINFIDEMNGDFPNFDRDRIQLFNQSAVLKNVSKNGMFDFFSNSFLVFAKAEE